MADSTVAVTAGTGTNIDTRTEATNGHHRQVVVLGDPSTNAGVAPVDATAGLTVDLGTNNDVTVTGTVTANLSATDNTVLDSIETATEATQTAVEILDNAISGSEMQVDVVSDPALSSATDSVAIYGSDDGGTNKRIIKTDSGGAIQVDLEVASVTVTSITAGDTNIGNVDIASIAAGDTNIGNVDIATVPAPLNVVGGGTEAAALRVTLANDSTGVISVDDNAGALTVDGTVAVTQSGTWDEVGINDSGNSITVDNGGTFAVQAAIADAADVTIGAKADAKSTATDTTPVTAMQVLKEISYMEQAPASRAVTNAGTFVTQINGDALTALQSVDNLAVAVDGNYLNTNINIAGTDVVGGAGAVAAGVQRVTLASDDPAVASLGTLDNAISGSEMQVDVVGALPAGTNAVGKLLPPDIDVTSHTNYARKYYTSAGAATDGIIWSPAAGKRWHVVTMYIQTSAAATVTLEDDKAGGDDPIWKGELAANGGAVLSFSEHYPLASGEDAADLMVTTTAGNIYITAVGYEI